jgi:hypothetical protein
MKNHAGLGRVVKQPKLGPAGAVVFILFGKGIALRVSSTQTNKTEKKE